MDKDTPESYFQEWSRFVKFGKPLSGYWASSDPKAIPPSNQCQKRCLFVDGFLTTSVVAESWIQALRDRLYPRPDNVESLCIKGMSYREPAWHYDARAINSPWQDQIDLFLDHMPQPPGKYEVIPIGFSHGTNVAVRASAKLVSSPSLQHITIPLIILIAPAHRVKPEVLKNLKDTYAKTHDEMIPISVIELAQLPRWHEQLLTAYKLLIDHGVHIHVLYSEDDLIVSPIQLESEYFHPYHVPITRRGKREPRPTTIGEEVDYHTRFRSTRGTLDVVQAIIENYSRST